MDLFKNINKNQIFKSIKYIGSVTFIQMFIAAIRNKVIAVYFGPSYIGIIGLFNQIVTTYSFSLMGSQTSVTRELADKKSNFGVSHFFKLFAFNAVMQVIILGLVLLFFKNILTNYLISVGLENLFYSLIISCILYALTLFLLSLFNGLRLVRHFFIVNVISLFISSSISLYVVLSDFAFGNISLYFILFYFSNFIIIFIYIINKYFKIFYLNDFLNQITAFKSIYKIGLILTGYTFCEHLYNTWLRFYITDILGTLSLGYFHASYSLSLMYVSIFTAMLSKDFMPAISELGNDYVKINNYIKSYIKFLFTSCFPIAIFLILTSSILFEIFFTSEFQSGLLLFELLCVVSFMKVLLFPLGFAVLGMGDTHAFVRQGPVVLSLNFILCFFIIPKYGLISYAYISLFCLIISYTWAYLYMNKITYFSLPGRYFFLLLLSLLILFTIIYIKHTFI